MDMETVHSFIAVARKKSISKAAQSLHVTQPTLSARLRKLEEGLGVPLVERGWDGIRLTKEGRFFLSYSIQLFRELEEASALLRTGAVSELDRPIKAVTRADRLRIGIESMFFPAFTAPVIRAIRRSNPETDCHFVCRSSELLMHLVDCGGLDLCVHYAGAGGANVRSAPLMDDRFVLIYPSDYPPVASDLHDAGRLKDKPFVLFDKSPLLVFRDVTEPAFKRLFGGAPDRFHIVSDVEAALEIVAGGFGFTFIPATSIFHLLDGSLPFRVVLLGPDFLSMPVLVSRPAAESPLHPLAEMAEAVLEELRAGASDLLERIRAREAG
jgi:DNA-binding transcriptional LysR family regulator